MYDPGNRHGMIACIPRDINGNRAGPLIMTSVRAGPRQAVICVTARPGSGHLPETGEVRLVGKTEP